MPLLCLKRALEEKSRSKETSLLDWGIMGMNILILLLLWSNLVGKCLGDCAIQPDDNGHVTIPSTWTSIGDSAFYQCSALQSVTIPDSVTSIGEWAFGSCSALQSVTIPDSVTTIHSCAFFQCRALQSVTIPDSVTSIGSYAFQQCSVCLLYTSPSPRDYAASRMPSSA